MKTTFLFFFSLFINGYTYSQWIDLVNPSFYHQYAVESVTEDLVYVGGYGGSLMKTVDGGANWSLLDIGTSEWVRHIDFFGESEGWICGMSGSIGPGNIYYTNDGGATWVSKCNLYDFTQMCWVTPTLGYVAGWNGEFLKTIDGGNTWTHLNLPITTSDSSISLISGINFLTENIGFISTAQSVVLKTGDGGITWDILNVPSDARSIYFFNEDIWYYLNNSSQIAKSTDGGVTFNYYQTPYSFKLNCVRFYDEMKGYVLGGLDCSNGSCTPVPALLKTIDGGQTWVEEAFPHFGQNIGYMSIDYSPNGIAYIGGSNQVVMKNKEWLSAASLSETDKGQLLIYPNPTSKMVNLSFLNKTDKICITNLLGELVYEREAIEMNEQIDLTTFSNGLYFIQVYSMEGSLIGQKKLLKE